MNVCVCIVFSTACGIKKKHFERKEQRQNKREDEVLDKQSRNLFIFILAAQTMETQVCLFHFRDDTELRGSKVHRQRLQTARRGDRDNANTFLETLLARETRQIGTHATTISDTPTAFQILSEKTFEQYEEALSCRGSIRK